MNENTITTPCISICKTDPVTGFCYGCGRSSDDKNNWKDPNTTTKWKEENLEIIRKRLSGWQLDSFNKSYLNKKKTGLSLLKQKLMESKNS